MSSRQLVEVSVIDISIAQFFPQYGVILQEQVPPERILIIFIGAAEAHTISNILKGKHSPRPLTYDLFMNILSYTSAQVTKVIISDLRDDIFYAEIHLNIQGETHVIDARPSDAIPYGLKWNVPIFVTKEIMDDASFLPNKSEVVDLPDSEIENRKLEIASLKKLLNELISLEKYEEAAAIRDKIKELEDNLNE